MTTLPQTDQDDPFTVAVTRVVKPGQEADFALALHRFAEASLRIPGQLGLHVLRPPEGSHERSYGILRTFENEAAYEAFLRTPLFQLWADEIGPMIEGEGEIRYISGVEAWFQPGASENGPPKWRLALLTYLAVNLVTTPMLILLMPLISSFSPFPFNNFLFNLPVVALLTWVVMPLLGNLLSNFLHPSSHDDTNASPA